MGKHIDELGTFDDFKAPWDSDPDAEVDKPKLKRHFFNLLRDKAKAQDARDESQERLDEVEKELEGAKKDLAAANGDEAQKRIDKLEEKVKALTSERDKLVADKEEAELRDEVLGDFAKEYPNAAKYVKGKTREELEKSLETVKEDFGIDDEASNENDGEDETTSVRTRPQRSLRNSSDPKNGKPGSEEIDWDKVANDIVGNGPFG